MNKQLVSSLVDVVLNLSPEDQKLFQAQLQARQLEKETHDHPAAQPYRYDNPFEPAVPIADWDVLK